MVYGSHRLSSGDFSKGDLKRRLMLKTNSHRAQKLLGSVLNAALNIGFIWASVMVYPTFTYAAPGTTESTVKKARTQYKNGLYTSAARLFAQLFEESGNAEYLYDSAISYSQAYLWDECVASMNRYLEIAPISPKRDRARNARDNCEARQQQSQTLKIESIPAHADIRLDNRNHPIVGTTPLVLKRPPGVLRVFIEKTGFEPLIRDVELVRGTPVVLSVHLKALENTGYLFVDASVVGAQVYLDGQAIRLTPFEKPLRLKAGEHQLQVTHPGFRAVNQQLKIDPKTLHYLPLNLTSSTGRRSWRSPVALTSTILGGLALAGGYVATQYANDHYRDTPTYQQISHIERIGYSAGAGLLATAAILYIWEVLHDPLTAEERNTNFGQPPELPSDAVNIRRENHGK